MAKLNATIVRNALRPGAKTRRYGDGMGLSLVVPPSGVGHWVLRVVRRPRGRRMDIGIGGARDVSLAEARDQAAIERRKALSGIDVIAERRATRTEETAKSMTFALAAREVHSENLPTWKNPKHAAQWLSTLETYVVPHIGAVPIGEVTTGQVRDLLNEIWLTRPETARRVRQRINTVIDWAVASNHRDRPIDMKAITKALPSQPKGGAHHAAMAYSDVPAFLAALRAMDSVSPAVRSGFEFLILTAARSGEVRGATWREVDISSATWTIPAERMKANEEHTVPLCDRALEILEEARARCPSGGHAGALVFPGARPGRPFSDMTLMQLLRRNSIEATAHGFRSSFRDWASEMTRHGRDLAEMALAHRVGDKTERAYARSTLLERRRALMEDWARFCCAVSTGTVVSLADARV
jgi:integrase